ncbi:putative acetyltransferase (GNAT) family protein [Lyophyllum shimeji]|uniref:Acetyltransferase (GNAT) family protein n=1 Tax=Lyophyllum shimeji TaxID=47721 RepID=A0A9P3PXE8_LYOSH|nr:putative acetyltransferase (GNAT) family protein [Lyophyllum shimeji]
MFDEDSELSDDYEDDDRKAMRRQSRRKRRKVGSGLAIPAEESLDRFLPLSVFDELGNGDPNVTSFQDIIDRVLPDYLHTRASLQERAIELDQNGQALRPPTRAEVSSLISAFASSSDPASVSTAITARKLKLSKERRRARLPEAKIQVSDTVDPLPPPSESHHPRPEVIDGFNNIQTTPFASSFLSRLQGTRAAPSSSTIAVDWETITPWMSLMTDIRDHYILSHPERERPVETTAPITYSSLERSHLREVHGLLERVFWQGIDVSDSLDHSPERCTIVASYKRLVVGVAILSSPRETYITYLAVRAGWDNARIARSMLYHLIMLNPRKDITLHVSVNNPAMLLYNQFGFKAEEFVAGFYENYLDPDSRASKNAFRLRLRQQ